MIVIARKRAGAGTTEQWRCGRVFGLHCDVANSIGGGGGGGGDRTDMENVYTLLFLPRSRALRGLRRPCFCGWCC